MHSKSARVNFIHKVQFIPVAFADIIFILDKLVLLEELFKSVPYYLFGDIEALS